MEMAMLEDMQIQASSMELKDLRMTKEKSKRLGVIGHFTGWQVQAQRRLRVTGAFYLGSRSMMAVMATEFEETYPADEVLRVFNSVDR